jgi:hypothetical protein
VAQVLEVVKAGLALPIAELIHILLLTILGELPRTQGKKGPINIDEPLGEPKEYFTASVKVAAKDSLPNQGIKSELNFAELAL